jgi:hypothetical protein
LAGNNNRFGSSFTEVHITEENVRVSWIGSLDNFLLRRTVCDSPSILRSRRAVEAQNYLPSFTGAYTPLWLAVDDLLGKKYGLDFEAVYAGRARPHQLLLSGDAQS